MILSIIMPAYNAQAHLGATLRGIAPMLGDAAELLFVDDGSTDHTADTFLLLRDSIPLPNSFLLRQQHLGVSEARNSGLAAARGDYVLFLDSDDFLSPDLLAALKSSVSDPAPDVVCWGWDTVASTGEVVRRYFDVHPELPARMTGVEALFRRTVDRSLRVWTASAAYRRTYVATNSLSFTRGCTVGEDLEFSYVALLHARNVAFLSTVFSTYCKRIGSVTSSPSLSRFESVLALKRVLMMLESDARSEVRPIATHFRRTKVAVNYFHTLESYLLALGVWSSSPTLRALDELYPRLTANIRDALRSAPSSWPFEWQLFARSPGLWWAWVRLRRSTDRFLPAKMRSTGAIAERRRAKLLAS